MGAEQEQDGKSWVSLGEIPGTQQGWQGALTGMLQGNVDMLDCSASWLCSPAQEGKADPRRQVCLFVFWWFWRPFHLIHFVSKTLLSPACSCPMLLPVLGTFDSCSISLFCQWATGSVLELDELEGSK